MNTIILLFHKKLFGCFCLVFFFFFNMEDIKGDGILICDTAYLKDWILLWIKLWSNLKWAVRVANEFSVRLSLKHAFLKEEHIKLTEQLKIVNEMRDKIAYI